MDTSITLIEDQFEVEHLNPRCSEHPDWIAVYTDADTGVTPPCAQCDRDHRAPYWPSKSSRIEAKSENYEMDLLLDIHNLLFPLEPGDRFTLVVATTLDLDGALCDGTYEQSKKKSLADSYDYVMHGQVYNTREDGGVGKMQVFISFGGMIMRLDGDARNLDCMVLDKSYYLLLRRA